MLQNQQVKNGLSLGGIVWAFSHEHAGNWHPLTTISHMLDVQMFGLAPAGHHFINVLLHSVAALLLFLLLRQMTGAFWRSALVAAIFAIHPLRAESVAWVAERKDVLSAVFFMLTIGAYARYARQPGLGRYLTTTALLACGLLSKPMLVTVPFVLLLLDYWPLERSLQSSVILSEAGRSRRTSSFTLPIPKQSLRKLIFEKIPLVILSVPTAIATFLIQERSPESIEQLPFVWRLENALVSCVTYLWQMIWPMNLAVFYPHPEDQLALWQVALAAMFLFAMTLVVFGLRRTRPYLLVGWLWYLVMLLPVLGIVQVGLQAHADRYTYLPQVGVYLVITWFLADLTAPSPFRRQLGVAAAIVVIGLLGACSWKQVGYWKDSETLWRHALAVNHDNDVADANLGLVLAEDGRVDEGIAHLQNALAIRSGPVLPHHTLSLALIHCDLGYALARKGALDEAVTHLREAVILRPNYPDAHYNLASALAQQGDNREALEEYRRTLALRPDDADARTSFGNTLAQEGLITDAMAQYEAALQLAPDAVLTLNNLAWILSVSPNASIRNGAKGVGLAERAVRLSGGKNAVFLRTLAAAYAESGRFLEAVETAQQALELAGADPNPAATRVLGQDIELYRAHAPLRDANFGH